MLSINWISINNENFLSYLSFKSLNWWTKVDEILTKSLISNAFKLGQDIILSRFWHKLDVSTLPYETAAKQKKSDFYMKVHSLK